MDVSRIVRLHSNGPLRKPPAELLILCRQAVCKRTRSNYLHITTQKQNTTRGQEVLPGMAFDILLFLILECSVWLLGIANSVKCPFLKTTWWVAYQADLEIKSI